eukprot:XP_028343868.1 uncharacterized protein LOC114485948 [Physeter catodon]
MASRPADELLKYNSSHAASYQRNGASLTLCTCGTLHFPGRNYPTYDRNDMPGKPVKAQHGDLTDWAKQGVFLMNTVLTVRENSPLSHKNAGWERFTDKVVNIINTRCDGAVFLLWGKPAQKKSSTLDRQRHLILGAGHPSPLSVPLSGAIVETDDLHSTVRLARY